ncbi:hypothetical protein Asd1617_02582 [Shigella dysenteriae 1617]|uniref:Uncharacterized protein n=1 Tax=Shigella dysenteriae 1617 TaxID=754093 RepID=A0A0A6ZU75_SHIDY|nr:hypothetical protein Asd1617_01884 [Shigella dysenteriae 1617]AHA65409.1 hypothetical protein Asd1617_02582 [Shigella dysenteriae 1617]
MRFSTIVSVVTLVWGISPRQPSGKNIIRWLLKKEQMVVSAIASTPHRATIVLINRDEAISVIREYIESFLQSSASSLSSGEYLPGSLQGKISSDGCA